MKKQKNVFISNVLFYGGFTVTFISILLLLIYTIMLENYNCGYIHMILFISIIIGIVSPLFASRFNLYFYFSIYNPDYKLQKALRVDGDTGFIQGVPNNKYADFENLRFIFDGIITLNYTKGLFYGDYKNKKLLFDMNGWIFKKKYIYEIFHTAFRINYINKNKLPLKYVYANIKNPDVKALTLILKNGRKEKKYSVSKDGKVKSKISIKYKNYVKSKFINSKKISILDFYDLNV